MEDIKEVLRNTYDMIGRELYYSDIHEQSSLYWELKEIQTKIMQVVIKLDGINN
jgi:hypothetical protein